MTIRVSAWSFSHHQRLEDMPITPQAVDYRLMDRVSDATRVAF
jgi:hypothetical protein